MLRLAFAIASTLLLSGCLTSTDSLMPESIVQDLPFAGDIGITTKGGLYKLVRTDVGTYKTVNKNYSQIRTGKLGPELYLVEAKLSKPVVFFETISYHYMLIRNDKGQFSQINLDTKKYNDLLLNPPHYAMTVEIGIYLKDSAAFYKLLASSLSDLGAEGTNLDVFDLSDDQQSKAFEAVEAKLTEDRDNSDKLIFLRDITHSKPKRFISYVYCIDKTKFKEKYGNEFKVTFANNKWKNSYARSVLLHDRTAIVVGNECFDDLNADMSAKHSDKWKNYKQFRVEDQLR